MYVGYQPKAPAGFRRPLRLILIVIAVVLVVSAVSIVTFQHPFSSATFEYGQLTEIDGILDLHPVPRLILHAEASPKSILLVGFGKVGAEGTIEAMENKHKMLLDNRNVRLRGTLIYGEGKTLLELTEGHASLISTGEPQQIPFGLEQEDSVRLHGQIIDPKCYFGVMKPGEGKVHRACATRCVSGGIPPVLKVTGTDGSHRFYLLKGPAGQPIHNHLLPYIADQVVMSGMLYTAQDWLVLRIDPRRISVL